MEIEGKIILDLPEEGGTSKAGNLWRKKSWVLETFGQYPRKVKFDLFGDRIDQVRLEAGKSYKVSVDAESREFNGRWYTDLRAYAAQEMGAPQMQQAPAQQFGSATAAPAAPADPFAAAAAPAADPFASGDTDDLPF
ncbi:MAG: DUF3127 domain-containing protein [Muribaculaceae bacterium]|jgi:hypothetical protein|uniref:DUF3127 domain-containing protein n=1 Tax=Sangeribacter muris TaxID=2880703 RepID=UPI000E8C5820|nr:DUF3127 domain-containing protein [Sangeribacter muris]MBJ2192451.1 DUF3127 domain-containing protein [Muribaculaceae bacterium]ROS82458.1 DUF3127 domain-containing protein [Muribaculaceae bacterium Isolate-036 (Harlan)]ROT22353.1 DUF3127 domain-containing protein [Muribaculaceae bacterium Isolate-114 (HZI)]ROT24330.1 DUF3127 domain-containing protein [Muribaculaceae bacterium Isolate-113 (HZI)]RXE67827.1 DUF3127 domain-containing protein [Muribaculaceae bacterium Isolate-001 (NCI)]HBY1752